MAYYDRLFQTSGLNDAQQIPGHGSKIVPVIRFVAMPMTPLVHGDDCKILGQDRSYQIPDMAGGGQPVQQHTTG